MKYRINYALTFDRRGSIETEIDKKLMELRYPHDVFPLICEKHGVQPDDIVSAVANPMEKEVNLIEEDR